MLTRPYGVRAGKLDYTPAEQRIFDYAEGKPRHKPPTSDVKLAKVRS